MAENTTSSTSQTSTPQSQPASQPSRGKLTILPSTEDSVAQPDSFRGSEDHLKDLDITDLEQDRRDKMNPPKDPKAS